MLLKLLFTPFVAMAKGFINLLPEFEVTSGVTGFVGMITTAFDFFPYDVWIALLTTIFFWCTVFLIKSVVNLVLGILPFINMHFG